MGGTLTIKFNVELCSPSLTFSVITLSPEGALQLESIRAVTMPFVLVRLERVKPSGMEVAVTVNVSTADSTSLMVASCVILPIAP